MLGSDHYRARRGALFDEAIDALTAARSELPPREAAGLEACLGWLAVHREPEWSRIRALAWAEELQDELAIEGLLGLGTSGPGPEE